MSLEAAASAAGEGGPSCEICGWAAAFCSMLAFGSFGVPIKSPAAVSVNIDPLVFQSYKTFMCFATSWLVILFGLEPFTFTPWGILSGLFWVPSGVATVYAVKTAGLAIGIGVGSSFIVMVSFWWGIFVFNEHVHSKWGASFAILCMIMGLVGMSYYSSPDSNNTAATTSNTASGNHENNRLTVTLETPVVSRRGVSGTNYTIVNNSQSHTIEDDSEIVVIDNDSEEEDHEGDGLHRIRTTGENTGTGENEDVALSFDATDDGFAQQAQQQEQHVVLCGVKVTKRQSGILSATFCGLYGGSIMVPMKFAPPDANGVGFLISFSIGASIVTISLWLVRFLFCCHKYQSASVAYNSLPSFHLRIMWLPGGISGLLWSIGNFFSLFSVYFLGEGVGYPLVQTSILVSGLWGIFYFKEVTGVSRVLKWLASSLLTICGILLLSYEHHAS